MLKGDGIFKVAGDALKGDEKAFIFNEEVLKSDSNALNDDGDVLKGRFGCVIDLTGGTKEQCKSAKG